MKEKKLHRFEQRWMASAVQEELQKSGIESRVVSRPREYTSILLGGVQDSADLLINEKDYILAKRVMDSYLSQGVSSEETEAKTTVSEPRNYGKRVIVFSLLGFLLPVIFNAIATMNFLEMNRHRAAPAWRVFVFLILIGGWFFAFTLVAALVRDFTFE